MSLLSEASATVLQASYVSNAPLINSLAFAGVLGPFKVLTGSISPRETQVSILFQDSNGNPLKLPAGSIPVRAHFVPNVPIVSDDLTDTFFSFTLYDNVALNAMYSPWSGYSDCDGERMNAKMMLDLVDNTGTAAQFADYPYVGMLMSGNSPVLEGTVTLYLYFV